MNAYHDMLSFLQSEGLAIPPVPQALAEAVRREGDTAFAAQAPSPGGASRFWLGMEGHGINSNTLRYELRHGPLSLLLVRRWGNAYDDPEQASSRIEGVFETAARLVAVADRLAQAGKFPAGRRLVVQDTDDADACWAWIAAGEDGDPELSSSSQPAFDALMNLMEYDRGQ
jgi:hypothetical protein